MYDYSPLCSTANLLSFYVGWSAQKCAFLVCRAVLKDNRAVWDAAVSEADRLLILLGSTECYQALTSPQDALELARLSAALGDGPESWWGSGEGIRERGPDSDELFEREQFLKDPTGATQASFFPCMALDGTTAYPVAGTPLRAIDLAVHKFRRAGDKAGVARLGALLAGLCYRITPRMPVAAVNSVFDELSYLDMIDVKAENSLRRSLHLCLVRKDPSPAPSDTRPSPPIEISPGNLKPGAQSYFDGMIHEVVEDEAAVLRCVFDRFGISVPPAQSDAHLQPILLTLKAQLVSAAQRLAERESVDASQELSNREGFWAEEAVTFLGLDRRGLARPDMALQRLIKKGLLHPVKVGGRLSFKRAELERLQQKGDDARRPGRPKKTR